jgi:hydrogenase nickel incorporation protein HypB
MNRQEFRRRILADNDRVAVENRRDFETARALVIDVVSSPGSGKTSLLCETARRLAPELSMAAVVGDIATELDADRLREAGLPAHQIVTGGACHLDARMLRDALPHTPLPAVDVLFVENVGNLVCPASYDLGEDLKVALLSVAAGHDKPFKYPAVFARAAVTVITKTDLLPHVSFDVHAVEAQVRTLNPDARVVLTSVVTGEGLEEWCALLEARLSDKRPAVISR